MAVAIFLNASAVCLCQSLRSRVLALTPLLLTVMTLPAPVADLPKVMAASRPCVWSKPVPSVCLLKNQNAPMKSFGQIDFFQEKCHLPKIRSDMPTIEEPLRKMRQHFLGSSTKRLGTIYRSAQKFATASQTLGFVKQSSLRTVTSQPSLRDGTLILKLAGGARAAVWKFFQKNLICLLKIKTTHSCLYQYFYIICLYSFKYLYFFFSKALLKKN